MADLLTLAEYKALQGIQAGDTRNDAQIQAILPAVSRLIRTYTGRQFEANSGIATSRSFQYDESGMLDIDDCTAVTSLTVDLGLSGQTYELRSDEYTVMPQDDSDVYYYVLIHGGPYFGGSPEMGFTRNLDQYPSLMLRKSPLISVTALWGWSEVPGDVKLAATLTTREFLRSSGNKSENLSAEAIEGFSRSWANANGVASLAVPNRARDLLAPYQRIFI